MSRSRSRYVVVLLLWLFSSELLADYPIEIIDLKHQTVDQMIPLITPFLGKGDTVTGIRGQLIVKTAPENLSQILKIVDSFDRASRQLMIYVAQGDRLQASRSRAHANVDVDVGDHGNLTIGNPPSTRRGVNVYGDGVSVSVDSQQRVLDDDITQRVRATEGMPAFIATGVALPIPVESRQGIARGSRITYGYGDASSGFYVVPQIHGQMVTLQINPRRQQPGAGHSIQIQEVSTQVTGRVGEWIELGSTTTVGSGEQNSILGRGSQQHSAYQPIRVMVQVLDEGKPGR